MMFPDLARSGALWVFWGALGRRSSLLLGPRGSTLGSRVELGAISGAVLGPVGVILAPLWLHIGILGGSWADFGPIWAPLGAHLATLWPLLAPFGPLLGTFCIKNKGQTKTKQKTPTREVPDALACNLWGSKSEDFGIHFATWPSPFLI